MSTRRGMAVYDLVEIGHLLLKIGLSIAAVCVCMWFVAMNVAPDPCGPGRVLVLAPRLGVTCVCVGAWQAGRPADPK